MSQAEAAPASKPHVPSEYSDQAIHLMRTATLVNLTLSQMADQKANILMGATFVVFTIAVGRFSQGEFPYALLVLAVTSFLSAVLSVLAVLPSVKTKPAASGTENILFFGVFGQLSEEEFTVRLLNQLDDDERVLRTMARDIHQNGMVLQRKKYRFLSLAYRCFLIGLTVTLIVFLVETQAEFGSVRLG